MDITDDYLNASDKCLDLAVEGLRRIFKADLDFLKLTVVIDLNDKFGDTYRKRDYLYNAFVNKIPPFTAVESEYVEAVAISLTSASFFEFMTNYNEDIDELDGAGLTEEELAEMFLVDDYQQYYYCGLEFMSVQNTFDLNPDEEDFVFEEQFDEEKIYIAASFALRAIKKYREARKPSEITSVDVPNC